MNIYVGTDEAILPPIIIKKTRCKQPISMDIYKLLARKKEVKVFLERIPCTHAQNFSNCIIETPTSRNHFRIPREGRTVSSQIRSTFQRRISGEHLTQVTTKKKLPKPLQLKKHKQPKELKMKGNYFLVVKEQLNKILEKFSLNRHSVKSESILPKRVSKKVSASLLFKEYFPKLAPLNASHGKDSLLKIIRKKPFPIFIPSPNSNT